MVLDSAAHYPFAERPDEFFVVLKTFVERAWPVSEQSIRNWREAVGGSAGL